MATAALTEGMLTPISSRCSLASLRMILVRSNGIGRATGSRFRNMFWYTGSWLISARSWYTTSMPASLACCTELHETSLPSRYMAPEVGGWNPQMILIKVDLPAPLSPSRPRISPRPSRRFTSVSAVTAP